MQTFSDFMEEAFNYEYSREHFELCKECANIQLMDMYIESQIFMAGNAGVINSGNIEFTEGFLFESVEDTDAIKAIYEEAEAKKQNILKRIWEKFKQWVAKFGNWLLKVTGAKGKYFIDINEYNELCKKLESLGDEKTELLAKIADLEEKYGFTVGSLETANRTIENLQKQVDDTTSENKRLKKVSSDRAQTIAQLEKDLKEANIKIVSMESEANKMKYAVQPEALIKAIKPVIDRKGNVKANPKKLLKVSETLKSANSHAAKNGIRVAFDGKSWTELAEEVRTMLPKFTELAADEVDVDADTLSKINETLSLISKTIASTMEFMNRVCTWNSQRIVIIRGIGK